MRDPDKADIARAWQWKAPDDDPNRAAHVDTWFINGPFHPHWSWWVLMCVDLIDRPGQPKAEIRVPGAEFEVMILSLSPDWEPDPDAKPGLVPYLTPADLVYQFGGVTREVAAQIVEMMVDSIVKGVRSPDSDHRRLWEQSLDVTVEHYKEGRHDPA